MTDKQFLKYVGPYDLHDGRIVAIEQGSGTVNVRIETSTGREVVLEFAGVSAVEAVHAEGLLLYALAEFSAEPPLRHFEFAPWDEDAPARVAISATDVRVR